MVASNLLIFADVIKYLLCSSIIQIRNETIPNLNLTAEQSNATPFPVVVQELWSSFKYIFNYVTFYVVK